MQIKKNYNDDRLTEHKVKLVLARNAKAKWSACKHNSEVLGLLHVKKRHFLQAIFESLRRGEF